MVDPKPSRASLSGPAFAIFGVVAAAIAYALPSASGPPSALSFLGHFHPLTVHLPIGIILLLALLEVLSATSLRARVDPAVTTVLRVALLTAVAALALGLLLAHEGGFPPKLLRLHKLLTLAMVVGLSGAVAAWWRVSRGAPRIVYRAALLVTIVLLSIGAHFGGSMTYGENYLNLAHYLKPPAPPPPPLPASKAVEPRVFADAVMPILREKCFSCHGPEKSNGGMRFDTLEGMKNGTDGPAYVVGHSDQSLLVTRIKLPATEDEHMPPADKPQVTPAELELLAFWVDSGATTDQRVKDVLVPDGAHDLLKKTAHP